MQFYKIYGELEKNENEEGIKIKKDLSYKIASRTAEFNGTNNKCFCFPRECKKIKAQFYENLGTMSFIEVREDFDNITSDEITTITAEDIVVPEKKKCETRRIGFC